MVDSNLNEGGVISNPEWLNTDDMPIVWTVDLSAVTLSDETNNETLTQESFAQSNEDVPQQMLDESKLSSLVGSMDLWSVGSQKTEISQSVFTDTWNTQKKKVDQSENFWSYLRIFFISSILTLLGLLGLALAFSFNKYYVDLASQNVVPSDKVEFVNKYKNWYKKIKWLFNKDNVDNYSQPNISSPTFLADVNKIINADDIDYIEKKDLLASSVSNLTHEAENHANEVENLRQEIARQGFLPEEVKLILSDNQAIETIQRSLNALEVIKFSTAAKVFSYMTTTLSNIAEMVKMRGIDSTVVGDFLTQITSRWEKDINAYVNMCYLNPFEYDSDCNVIWDLDLYYKSILKDNSIDIDLLKNVMNGMNQLLEDEDSATFSITFNGFNAQDEDITFDIEVFTSQADEIALMAQWKKNPNIFILTNIVNLLKQSTFVIGAEIDMHTVEVELRTLARGWFTTLVNYSSQTFTVPIQKNTEREVFDYIDVDKLLELIDKMKVQNEPEDGDRQDENVIQEDDNYLTDGVDYTIDYENDANFEEYTDEPIDPDKSIDTDGLTGTDEFTDTNELTDTNASMDTEDSSIDYKELWLQQDVWDNSEKEVSELDEDKGPSHAEFENL